MRGLFTTGADVAQPYGYFEHILQALAKSMIAYNYAFCTIGVGTRLLDELLIECADSTRRYKTN